MQPSPDNLGSGNPVMDKVLAQAADEADHCGAAQIDAEHLLLAICSLCYTPSLADHGGQAVKQAFEKAGHRAADVATALRARLVQPAGVTSSGTRPLAEGCRRALEEAQAEAAEEPGRELELDTLLRNVLLELEQRPLVRQAFEQLHVSWTCLVGELGLSPSAPSGILPQAAPPSRAVAVPNQDVLDKLSRADETMRREQWTEAAQQYQEALDAYPVVSPAWNNLGVAYMRLRRFEEAKRSLEMAISVDARNADAHANLGIVLARDLHQPQQAIEHLNEALRIDPKHVCRTYLQSLLCVGTNQEAVGVRSHAAGRLPRPEDIRLPPDKEALADAMAAQGKLREALAIYEDFLKTWTHSLQALNNAGSLYNRLHEPGKACELLEKAVALDPTYVRAWNNLGTARRMLEDFAKAEEAYRTVLKLDPANVIARANLAALLAEKQVGRMDQVRLVPPVAAGGGRPTTRPSPHAADFAGMISRLVGGARRTRVSLDQLQHAADYQLLPKSLLMHALVCLFLGLADVVAGLILREEGWQYWAVAGLGGSLALIGVLSKLLRRRAGFAIEGGLLLVMAIGFSYLFAAICSSAGEVSGLPWGRIILLTLLTFAHLKAGFESLGRYRRFAGVPTGRPSEDAVRQLEEIRKQILSAEAGSSSETIEFQTRNGRWKGRLEFDRAIFINANLGDVLLVRREDLKIKLPPLNTPLVWLLVGKYQMAVRMDEPSATRLKQWCLPANKTFAGQSQPLSTDRSGPGN